MDASRKLIENKLRLSYISAARAAAEMLVILADEDHDRHPVGSVEAQWADAHWEWAIKFRDSFLR